MYLKLWHGCLLPNLFSLIHNQCRPLSEEMYFIIVRTGIKFCKSVSACMDKMSDSSTFHEETPAAIFMCTKTHQLSLFQITLNPNSLQTHFSYSYFNIILLASRSSKWTLPNVTAYACVMYLLCVIRIAQLHFTTQRQ